MKNKTYYSIVIISLLYFGLIFQAFNIFLNLQEYKTNMIKRPQVSASGSLVYEWNRTWGGVGEEYGFGVMVDQYDNIYFSGYSYSFVEESADAVLVKYNGLGIEQWNQTWGGPKSEICNGLAMDSLDNIYLSGSIYDQITGDYDLFLVKFDNAGVQQWNHTWVNSNYEEGYGIAVDSSDNVYFTGDTNSTGGGDWDLFLVKHDNAGVQQWNYSWGGNNDEVGIGIAVDSLDYIYVAGITDSFGAGNSDALLVKYDDSGIIQWNRTWGGNENDYCSAIALDSSDNIYLTGYTDSFGAGGYDIFLVKFDNFGVQQWNCTWGGFNSELSSDLALDSSENIIVTGETYSFGLTILFLVKFNSFGVRQWNFTWGWTDVDQSLAITIDSIDNVYTGGSTGYSGTSDMILVKFKKGTKDGSKFVPGLNLTLIISLMAIVTAIVVRKKLRE